MQRLVYAPYVQAFVKTDYGVVDLSPYLVSGSINRKINQVSGAQLTLRNPVQGSSKNLLFTEYIRPNHGGTGPLIHPQDPIIIIMQRLQGHPVPVFTGYVDKAPYLQFYPGLVTIEASCTLKRLLYTQWDAALPFVQTFLQQYGWVLNSATTIVSPSSQSQRVSVQAGQIQGQFNDGSIGALLAAVLVHIGAWDPSTIFIEALPSNIKDIVTSLYQQISQEVDQSEGLFQSLISDLLGTGSQGTGSPTSSGGGGSVGSPLLNQNQRIFGSSLSLTTGLDPNVVAAWILDEEPASATQAPNGANNWLNIGATGSGNFGGMATIWNDPRKAGVFTGQWMQGTEPLPGFGSSSAGIQSIEKTAGQPPATQIRAIQVSGWAASGYPNLPLTYQEVVKAGGNTVTTAGAKTANTANASLAPATSAANRTTSLETAKAGKSPGGKQGKTGSQSGSYLATIFPGSTSVLVERTDMGVDFALSDGLPIGAIGAGTVSLTTSTGFANQPLLMVHLDTPIDGYHAWYISEGIRPTKTSGHVNAGDQIAVTHSNGTGIETGWADPSTGYPVASSYYHEGDQTRDGIAFANTIGVPVLASGSTQTVKVTGTPITGGGGAPGTGSSTNDATAAAFAAVINLPSIFSQAEALAFTGKRSFIADQPLFPFIEQLCAASLRNFMSMPNGNFFAFFPDYFGLFGRKYYWEINDIEIMDARIDLTDDPLVTYVAVAGDVTQWPETQLNVFDLIQTSGIFTIFDAISTGYVGGLHDISTETTVKEATSDRNAALNFLQRYGARSYVEEAPMIRSPIFELFVAFQRFMLLWSKQFQTAFELTFMPELFPGGLVSFPDHHLQCYIEEVVHDFDYSGGFTTTVNVSSPSKLDDQSSPALPDGLARPVILGTGS